MGRKNKTVLRLINKQTSEIHLMSVHEFCTKAQMNEDALYKRMSRGWTLKKILEQSSLNGEWTCV